MKRNIRITVSYDGTDFCGWQVQNNGRTVQGDIEAALLKIHGTETRLTGSGRTDSGVHANGQVANFYTFNDNIPAEKFQAALNSLLSGDVRVINSAEVNNDFNARYDARVRIYRYYIQAGGICEPRHSRYCWRIREMPDLSRLNRIAAPLLGVHDFTSFTAAGDPSNSRIRELFSASFTMEGQFIVFKIAGNAFLWKMVRSITGTILGIAAEGGSAGDMADILNSMDRERALTTAPAHGLFLDRVLYDERTII
jgi:tRNA pseudouridine38-40 synthase